MYGGVTLQNLCSLYYIYILYIYYIHIIYIHIHINIYIYIYIYKKKTQSTNFKYDDPLRILLGFPPYKYITTKTYG